MRSAGGYVFFREKDSTTVGSMAARDQVEQGCFSSTIGSHQADDFTLANAEIDFFQGPLVPEFLTQCFQS